MSKVYVANLGGHDFSDAERYGELVFLTTHGYAPKELDRLMFELVDSLKVFDPEKDYFLPVGQDLVNLTTFWLLTQKSRKLKVLYWEFKERRYVCHTYTPDRLQVVLNNLKLREEMERHG